MTITTCFSRMPLQAPRKGLTNAAHRTLEGLCGHVDRYGRAWPSLSRLAWCTGLDRRKVSGALDELETKGLIIRERRMTRGGACRSTKYQVVYEDWPAAPDDTDRGSDAPDDPPPPADHEDSAGRDDSDGTGGGAGRAPVRTPPGPRRGTQTAHLKSSENSEETTSPSDDVMRFLSELMTDEEDR